MTSSRQREANRRNAQSSTGPRTKRGKARVARNAWRHGLSLPVFFDPSSSKDVEQLSRTIVGDEARPEILALACRIVESQVDILRVRKVRRDFLMQKCEHPCFRLKDSALAVATTQAGVPVAPVDMTSPGSEPDSPEELTSILKDFAKQLARWDRYERRALSRRKFAVRALDVARRRQLSITD